MTRNRYRTRRAAVALAAVAAAWLAPLAPSRATLPATVGGQALPSLAPMIKIVAPAVVNIAARGRQAARQNPLLADPFLRRFFNLPPASRRHVQSVGSGVIVDAERGLVVTNNHVIAGAEQIVVTLRDRRQLIAQLVGADPDTDIAVLRVRAEALTGIDLGDSDALEVGDFVIAIGNPFGIGQTVTSGIVSALRRSGLGIEGYEDFIQTDASINPGNSGGALVTLAGKLIGVNTAILGPGGGNVGIGFAIPINMVRQVMEQIVAYGEVRRGRLGAQAQDLTPDLAAALGLDDSQGALVATVVLGSPAERADLRPGDVIVAIDGRPVRTSADVRNAIGLLRVGDVVAMAIDRDGERMTIRAEIAAPRRLRIAAGNGADTANSRLAGATFATIDETSPLFGRVQGVMIEEVEGGSSAWRVGLRKDDVVIEINRRRVRDLDALEAMVAAIGDGSIVLRIRRGDGQLFIVMR